MSSSPPVSGLLPAEGERSKALDGLRGLASLAVVFHHLSLTSQWYALRVFHPASLLPSAPWTSLRNLAEYSPLHLFYAGTEAVVIFFVLSGLVLVRSVRTSKVRAYGLSRMVRLYLPIWGSVLFSVVIALLYVSNKETVPNAWLQARLMHISWNDVVGNSWIIDGNTTLNSVYWSMKYEVVFSLLLPVVLWPAMKNTPNWQATYLKIAGLIAMTAIGSQLNLVFLEYLPMFFVGVVLMDVDPPKRFELSMLVAGIIILTSAWTLGGFGIGMALWVSNSLTVLGAALIVQSLRGGGLAARFCATAPIEFLGKISFSLYLVHVPIILFIWFKMGPVIGPKSEGLHGVAALAIALVVATVFYVLVEKKAIDLAHHVKKRLQRSS